MSHCPALVSDSNSGIAAALRSIDCRTSEATGYAFGRLFGDHGSLLPALTILLTLYVAFFAISLLTGRTQIGVSALTPRMMTLGLVLTFATSWAAYQNVIWTVTTGAPDEIASVLVGSHGSATNLFAGRLDLLFNAIADAAQRSSVPVTGTQVVSTPQTVGGFSGSTVLWLSALMLLLGTVGVLVTAKLALAVLLALGPIFIVLALFRGTHGLFEGWLKGLVMFAVTPLFAVLLGGTAVAALTPMVRTIAASTGQPPARDVAVLFLGTFVYLALMVLSLKAAGAIVAGWRISNNSLERPASLGVANAGEQRFRPVPASWQMNPTQTGMPTLVDDRVSRTIAGLSAARDATGSNEQAVDPRIRRASAQIITIAGSPISSGRTVDQRLQGIGSRFRTPPPSVTKGMIS